MKQFIDFAALTVEDAQAWARRRAGRKVYLECLDSLQDAYDAYRLSSPEGWGILDTFYSLQIPQRKEGKRPTVPP